MFLDRFRSFIHFSFSRSCHFLCVCEYVCLYSSWEQKENNEEIPLLYTPQEFSTSFYCYTHYRFGINFNFPFSRSFSFHIAFSLWICDSYILEREQKEKKKLKNITLILHHTQTLRAFLLRCLRLFLNIFSFSFSCSFWYSFSSHFPLWKSLSVIF